MKKKCQYILLPTEKISQIYIQHEKLYFEKYPVRSIYAGNQFLYILSDDEIKEGDKCYDKVYNRIVIAKSIKENFVSIAPNLAGLKHSNISNLKKIIATTDPELHKILVKEDEDWNDNIGAIDYSEYKEGIPSISQSDIEYIISLYNEDKRVDIEVKANKWALDNADKTMETNSALNKGFIGGYNQYLQDNVDKKFTLEDMKKCFEESRKGNIFKNPITPKFISFTDYIQSLIKEQSNNNTLIVKYEYANGGYSNTNEPPPLIPKLKDNCIIIHKT